MDRGGVSGPSRGNRRGRHRNPPGLRVIERAGHWYIHGTCRVKGRSVRVRRGSGLPAISENRGIAEDIRRQIEQEIVDEVVNGVRPTRPLGIAARDYLSLDPASGEFVPGPDRPEPLGPTDVRIIQEIVARFGRRPLRGITGDEWNALLDERHRRSAASTRDRYRAAIMVFLKWCAAPARGYLSEIPAIQAAAGSRLERRRRRRHRTRRRVAELRPDLLAFFFERAPIHLRAQLYVEWSTGARLSSVLFGCRLCDLVLTANRCQITFRATKNGEDVTATLHTAAVPVLQAYLAWRGGLERREDPLFLTDRRKPYSRKGRERGWSGNNKTAFRAARRRAVLDLIRLSVQARRAGDLPTALQLKVDARLLHQVTQHWLRHWFATHAMAANIPLRLIMEQAGWTDERSVMGYQHDVPDVRRRAIESLPIRTSMTQSAPTILKKAGDSDA